MSPVWLRLGAKVIYHSLPLDFSRPHYHLSFNFSLQPSHKFIINISPKLLFGIFLEFVFGISLEFLSNITFETITYLIEIYLIPPANLFLKYLAQISYETNLSIVLSQAIKTSCHWVIALELSPYHSPLQGRKLRGVEIFFTLRRGEKVLQNFLIRNYHYDTTLILLK